MAGAAGVTQGTQRQEQGGPGPHLSWGRPTGHGLGADYRRARRVKFRRVVGAQKRRGRKETEVSRRIKGGNEKERDRSSQ